MDTEQLKTFLEVNRTRHFGRAAKNLFLSQSAVSARIQALEDLIGTPLFIRSRNDIQLTPAGHRLLSHAENILAAWNRAKHDVVLEDDQGGSLAVAGVPSLWDISLQDWLHQLRRQLPSLSLQAEVHDADIILRRLQEGSIDLGFTFEAPQIAQLEAVQIASVPLIMVSSSAGQSSLEAVQQNYVLVDWGLSFAIAHTRHFPDIPSASIRLPLGRIALNYLLSCGGSAYLAQPMVSEALANGQLFKVMDAPVIERSAYALYTCDSTRLDNIRQALALLSC